MRLLRHTIIHLLITIASVSVTIMIFIEFMENIFICSCNVVVHMCDTDDILDMRIIAHSSRSLLIRHHMGFRLKCDNILTLLHPSSRHIKYHRNMLFTGIFISVRLYTSLCPLLTAVLCNNTHILFILFIIHNFTSYHFLFSAFTFLILYFCCRSCSAFFWCISLLSFYIISYQGVLYVYDRWKIK